MKKQQAKPEILKFFLIADGHEIGREAIGLCRSPDNIC